MGKLFCLIGKSASGKDAIFRYLRDNKELGLKEIVPYTTRPMRKGKKTALGTILLIRPLMKKCVRTEKSLKAGPMRQ